MRRSVVAVVIVLALFSCRYESERRAREAALRDDLFEMRKAIDNYYADKKQYPATLQEIVSEHYLRDSGGSSHAKRVHLDRSA